MPFVKNPLAAGSPGISRTGTRPVRLGRVVATPGVLGAVPRSELFAALERHMRRDWGDVCEADWRANDRALKIGERLLSSYKSNDGVKFWIITERDRSSTTFLLPSEY